MKNKRISIIELIMNTSVLLSVGIVSVIILIFLTIRSPNLVIPLIFITFVSAYMLYSRLQGKTGGREASVTFNSDVWKINIVYVDTDIKSAKLLSSKLSEHKYPIVLVNENDYDINQPSYITIFVNHMRFKLYKSALTFVWKSDDTILFDNVTWYNIKKGMATQLPTDFNAKPFLETPYFSPYDNLGAANVKLMDYLSTVKQYTVGESVFTGAPPTADTFNYDDDYTFLVDPNDIVILPKLIQGIPWEKNLTAIMSAYVKPNSIVLDIGTNIGTVAIPLSRAVNKNCIIYAFEPYPPTWELLKENIIKNECKNVIPFAVCVGHKYETVVSLADKVYAPPEIKNYNPELKTLNIGNSAGLNEPTHLGAVQLGMGGYNVRMITIDQLLGNGYVSVMKVDIEGAEPLALYGARNTIRRCMPVIFYERNENIVTEEMKISMELSDEVANFDIVKFCRSLGYNKLYEIEFGNYMLLPPWREPTTPNPIHKFRPTKSIPYHNTNTLQGYSIYKMVRPKWN